MKIRIVSDLHVDVNKIIDFGFVEKINDCDLTLIAGDIGGDYKIEEVFLDELKKIIKMPVLCVGGNHLGYNYLQRGDRFKNILDGTKLWSLDYLSDKYDVGDIGYLNNQAQIIGDYVVFGGTMYSNFELYGNPDYYGERAEEWMNDFRYIYTYGDEDVRLITYKDYIKWFDRFLVDLKSCLQHYKDKNFIVLSHFAPSIKSISDKYNGQYKELNPAYASNLEEFIKEYLQIKLWVHGHMHDSFDYYIGQCRVVCEPYGYYGREQELKPNEYMGKVIEL